MNSTTVAESIDWIARVITLSGLLAWLSDRGQRLWRRKVIQSFFGGESVEVVIPMRILEGRTVVSEPDFCAVNQLSGFLGRHGIDVSVSFVSPSGEVDLHRPGLAVICGPKSSGTVAEAMENGGDLVLEMVEGNWTIIDLATGKHFDSPMDTSSEDQKPMKVRGDLAYVALLRPSAASDRTFLSIAGVHAEGSAGAVDYLCDVKNMRRLQKAAGGQRFAAVISSEFTDSPFSVKSSAIDHLSLIGE